MFRFVLIALALCFAWGTVAADVEQPATAPVAAKAPEAALEVATQRALEAKDRAVKSALRSYIADLNGPLHSAMDAANLDEANRIKSETDHAYRGETTASKDLPKNPQAVAARRRLDRTLAISNQKYNASIAVAAKKCIAELEVLVRKATKAGNLDEANQLHSEIERITVAQPSLDGPRTVELLDGFDASKDIVAGDWSVEAHPDGSALLNRDGRFCRIQFPYQPPAEYDFQATFNFSTKGGPIILMCPLTGGAVMWYAAFNMSGFESRGKHIVEGKEPFVVRGAVCTSLVKARKNKVQGYLNGRLVCEFDPRTLESPALTPGWSLPNARTLGIGVWASDITFSKVEVVEISGPGKPLR